MFGFLAWLLARVVGGGAGKWIAFPLLLFGILYPSLAGLDADRQTLYFNLCALVFLALAAWQLLRRLSGRPTPATPSPLLRPPAEKSRNADLVLVLVIGIRLE